MKVPRDGDRSRSATPYNLRPLRDRITQEHSSQTGRINGGTKTSDYSSGDEDRTPTPVPKPPPRTPLSRSELVPWVQQRWEFIVEVKYDLENDSLINIALGKQGREIPAFTHIQVGFVS